MEEQLEILRRIAERGLKKAQREQSQYVDLFQHLLDEIFLTKKRYYEGID